jgi:hypothetical protein
MLANSPIPSLCFFLGSDRTIGTIVATTLPAQDEREKMIILGLLAKEML